MKHLKRIYEIDSFVDEWESVDEPKEQEFHYMIIYMQGAEYIFGDYVLQRIEQGNRVVYTYGNNKTLFNNNNVIVLTEENPIRKMGYGRWGGVVYLDGHRDEAFKVLKTIWGSARGGLTRKVRKRKEELDKYSSQKDSLDKIFTGYNLENY